MTKKTWAGRLALIVGIIGQVLVAAGLLILLYVAYLLVGTSSVTKAAQHKADKELKAAPIVAATQSPTGDVPPARPASEPALGQALFTLKIPKIASKVNIVHGVGEAELKNGPGHFPDKPWPGEAGNVPISGHRTTYGAPFYNVDKLEAGDAISIESGQARYNYRVSEKLIVRPTDYEVVENRGKNELTLTSCHPRFSAAQRIVIHADYLGAEWIPASAAGQAAQPGTAGEDVPAPNQAIPIDVYVLAGVAVAAMLAAMALSRRMRVFAIYGASACVTGVAMWILIFPEVVRRMPTNY